ncbi:MAG: lipocalin family protein [Victivallaceae bacterium]|nr:lipocalin family protein [Victivallaceae bacterium]
MKAKALMMVAAGMLLAAGCSSSAPTADIPAVRQFSIERYLGTWYEIARLPHSFESDIVLAKAEYSMTADGKVKVVNSGIRNGIAKSVDGVAEMKGDAGVGELRVSFFRPFYGDYRIIYLAPDYSVAMVTSGTKDYLWLLARTPALSPEKMRECLGMAEKWGFPVELLQYPNRGAIDGFGNRTMQTERNGK